MITRREYILDKISSQYAGKTVAIDNMFIKYIQDLAVDIYIALHPIQIYNDPVRYIMTYCPYDTEEKRYAAQYEGSDSEILLATKYIDMAYHVVYWNLTGEGDMWYRYMGRR